MGRLKFFILGLRGTMVTGGFVVMLYPERGGCASSNVFSMQGNNCWREVALVVINTSRTEER